MLFNSTVFIFYFLPITVSLFYFLARYSKTSARIWLSVASLFFYGWWNPKYLLLISASTVVNYYCGYFLQNYPASGTVALKKAMLLVGLGWNIGLLVYFKYFIFIISSVGLLTGLDFAISQIVLPLAISFFTFQKIAYLVDSYLGKAHENNFVNFLLFVTFFPQLVAGPIVHHREMLPQIGSPQIYRFDGKNFADGVCIFLLGLAKKVVLADEFGRYADAGFNGAAQGDGPSLASAWLSVTAYTLQLYFDFSGYSDMAIGLARLFNMRLPMNFNSPYKATSIIDFWRRWHMTLSRFLRDYVYIPLGGNRLGLPRRYLNLLLTFLVCGLWHGAGWTFVLWGIVHGFYLSLNHFWNSFVISRDIPRWRQGLGCIVTFLAVMFSWVLFRSKDLETATRMYAGMLGLNGAYLPDQLIAILPFLRGFFGGVSNVPYLGDSTAMGLFEAVIMLLIGLGIVFVAPNLHDMSRRTRLMVLALSFSFTFQKVVFATHASPFLYFQF
jgi:alginate O-acetyltransferase complex protein AlgI